MGMTSRLILALCLLLSASAPAVAVEDHEYRVTVTLRGLIWHGEPPGDTSGEECQQVFGTITLLAGGDHEVWVRSAVEPVEACSRGAADHRVFPVTNERLATSSSVVKVPEGARGRLSVALSDADEDGDDVLADGVRSDEFAVPETGAVWAGPAMVNVVMERIS